MRGTTSGAPGYQTPRSAGTRYTAFARKKDPTVSAGLIIWRVRDLNGTGAAGPDELFPGLALPRLRRLTVRSHPGPNPMVR